MARRPGGSGEEVFRVVLKRPYGEEVCGPYGTLATAKGILTAATNPRYWNRSTGHIERATTAWVKVSA